MFVFDCFFADRHRLEKTLIQIVSGHILAYELLCIDEPR